MEIIGLILIGGTIYSFIGMTESELRWPVFWSCAAGAMAIIVYRNYMRKRKKNAQTSVSYTHLTLPTILLV